MSGDRAKEIENFIACGSHIGKSYSRFIYIEWAMKQPNFEEAILKIMDSLNKKVLQPPE